jgi:hypothetical protein
MLIANIVAEKLNDSLKKHGYSELTFSKNLFSGKASEMAGISGQILGRKFRVIMFEPSGNNLFPVVSAHFSSGINDLYLSDEKMAFWNADNRFTKLYHQDNESTFMVYDSFFPFSAEDAFIESVVNIWAGAMRGVSKF